MRSNIHSCIPFSIRFFDSETEQACGLREAGYVVSCQPSWVWMRLNSWIDEQWYRIHHALAVYLTDLRMEVQLEEEMAGFGTYGTVEGNLPEHFYYLALKQLYADYPLFLGSFATWEGLRFELSQPHGRRACGPTAVDWDVPENPNEVHPSACSFGPDDGLYGVSYY